MVMDSGDTEISECGIAGCRSRRQRMRIRGVKRRPGGAAEPECRDTSARAVRAWDTAQAGLLSRSERVRECAWSACASCTLAATCSLGARIWSRGPRACCQAHDKQDEHRLER